MRKTSSLDNSISFWEDEETGARYRRIVAGLCWPAVKPGIVVVVGEDLGKDSNSGKRNLRVLGETEENDITALFKKCLDFRKQYHLENFLADTEDRGMMDQVMQFNRTLESPLRLDKAPYIEDPKCFKQYALRIKNHLPPDKTCHTLNCDETSKIPGYLKELNSKDLLTANILDHPAIAALGFAVCCLGRTEHRPARPPQKEGGPGKIAKSYAIRPLYVHRNDNWG
jgi:hypothetical protein